jgi:hypothetical protein
VNFGADRFAIRDLYLMRLIASAAAAIAAAMRRARLSKRPKLPTMRRCEASLNPSGGRARAGARH